MSGSAPAHAANVGFWFIEPVEATCNCLIACTRAVVSVACAFSRSMMSASVFAVRAVRLVIAVALAASPSAWACTT
ncbi:hypothetical protein D3C80_1101690 [compost metagenome]